MKLYTVFDTAVLRAQYWSGWATEVDAKDDRDNATIWLKLSFGRLYYIATAPSYILHMKLRAIDGHKWLSGIEQTQIKCCGVLEPEWLWTEIW